MHRHQRYSGSSDDSMDNPPRMKSTVSSSKRRLEEPTEILNITIIRDDFNKLYEKDFPRLQRCMEKLHNIIRIFEKDFRRATKGTRDGGAVGLAGGVGLVAGIAGLAGLVLAPFTAGASLVLAGTVAGLVVSGAGAGAAVGGGIYGGIKSYEKERKMTKLKQDIEAELREFQNTINPFSEKIKEINERIEEILKDLDKLERDAIGVSEYFASTRNTRNIREHMTTMRAQMSIIKHSMETILAISPGVGFLHNLLSVIENNRVLDDIDYLAKIPIHEQIDESKINTKAGKFIVGMRKVIHELQNIMEEMKKTKQTMTHFFNII